MKAHQKIQHPKPTTRKLAPRKQKTRVNSITGKQLKGTGRTVSTDIPEGAIQSSSHVSHRTATLHLNQQIEPSKYFTTRGALGRDLRAFQYKRQTFPTAVFTMLYPGKQLPKDVSVFKVPLNYNRVQVKNYLEELYGVQVVKVNTAIMVGKRRLDQYARYTKEKDWKKAYVRTTEAFAFPWPRPITYSLTEDQKKKKIETEKKKKEAKNAAV